jgi:hypothetical protein
MLGGVVPGDIYRFGVYLLTSYTSGRARAVVHLSCWSLPLDYFNCCQIWIATTDNFTTKIEYIL